MKKGVKMWSTTIFLGFLLALNSQLFCAGFNLETKDFTLYRQSDAQSMFGFTVAVYRDKYRRGSVLVGAPQAPTPQPGVHRGGAVFRCNIDRDNLCDYVEFDKAGNVMMPGFKSQEEQYDNKTLQWFGATLATSKKDGGKVVACAPRYVWFGLRTKEDMRSAPSMNREPVGKCFVNDFENNEVKEFSPCRSNNVSEPEQRGYNKKGSCQAGMSAALPKSESRVLIGAPGSWYWQGQEYSISLTSDKTPVWETKEGKSKDDDHYRGYSVTALDFLGPNDVGSAVGIPRGHNLAGQVVLHDSLLNPVLTINGEQMGSYFGYSLTTGDIDGDGLDDLIIGAPMYTKPLSAEIETGRIYVYYQGRSPSQFSSQLSTHRDGECDGGRFGLSIASLGDIDLDGYGDLVVGAPYGGSKGRGAVYIYRGSKNGLAEKYSQVIDAVDIDSSLSTFGFSVSGGVDLDGNDYPDLAVGAYDSNSALFFRARPVIKMEAYAQFLLNPKLISVDKNESKNCALWDGTPVRCVDLKVCFNYTGNKVDRQLSFQIAIVLDVKKTKDPRMFFKNHTSSHTHNKTITLTKELQSCHTETVYLASKIRDKLTSIDAEVRMDLMSERGSGSFLRTPNSYLRPVLAQTTSTRDTVYIRKNCGSDNICHPDLSLIIGPKVDKYLLGSKKRLELEVWVENRREDAFEAMFSCKLPKGIDYVKVEKYSDSSDIPVLCSPPSFNNNNTLKCDIGNPLPQKEVVHFKVILDPVTIYSENASYNFWAEVSSSNQEKEENVNNNMKSFELPIYMETELVVEGESKPKDLYYNPENYTSESPTTDIEFGPAIVHNYTIRNHGPSDVSQAEAYLVWPAQTLAEDDLMYLVEQPETFGRIHCESANANYLSLKIEQRRRPHNYYMKPAGIYVDKQQENSETSSYKGSNSESRYGSKVHEEEKRRYESSSVSSSSERTHYSSQTSRPTVYRHNVTETYATVPYQRVNSPRIVVSTETSGIGDLSFSRGNFHSTSSWRNHAGYGEPRSTPGYVESTTKVYVANRHEISPLDKLRQQQFERRKEERREEEEQKLIEELSAERNRADERRKMQKERNRGGSGEYITEIYGNERKETETNTENRNQGNYNYGYERHNGLISGDREKTITHSDFITHLRNVTSDYDRETFMSILNSNHENQTTFKVHSDRNRLYVKFYAKQDVSGDNKLLLQFQNGVKVVLEDLNGGDVNVMNRNAYRSGYKLLEGCPMFGPHNEVYIVLNNGQRFAMQSSYYSRTEENYVINSGRTGESHLSWQRHQNANDRVQTVVTRTRQESHSREQTHETYGDNWHRDERYRREADSADEQKTKQLPKSIGPKAHVQDQLKRSFQDNTFPACEAARCVQLKCTLGPLLKDEEVSISVRYRINAHTLKKVAFNEQVKVSTQLVTLVTEQPFIGKPREMIYKNHEVYTNVQPTAPPAEPDVVPLWIVVLSACAGTIILLLLIFLLHKCGFFKRNRPVDRPPERQPLNGQGQY